MFAAPASGLATVIITSLFFLLSVFLCWNICLAQDWSSPSALTESIKTMQQAGLTWLREQANRDYGWDGGDTPRAILALAVVQDGWPTEEDLSGRLSAKQLEIELLEKLIRHDVEPVTPAMICMYALALAGICKDARSFYGNNLIASLERHQSDHDYPGYPRSYGFSLTTLVSCIRGSHLHKHQIRHLLLVAAEDSEGDSIETRATAILALECFRRKRRNEALTRKMREAVRSFALLQRPDGTFGNSPQETYVGLQALAVSSAPVGVSWNRTAAAVALSRAQRPDGSFQGSIQGTSEAILALTALLNSDGLLSLRRDECVDFGERSTGPTAVEQFTGMMTTVDEIPVQPTSTLTAESQGFHNQSTTDGSINPRENQGTTSNPVEVKYSDGGNYTLSLQPDPTSPSAEVSTTESRPSTPATESSSSTASPLILIRFWMWIGADPVKADKLNISIHVPVNSTFFTVMRRAAEANPQYQFGATVWPNGHYVHTLSGHREQPQGYHYWLLYKLPREPDPASPPPPSYVTPAGVDNLIVHDGDIYLYWYKKI